MGHAFPIGREVPPTIRWPLLLCGSFFLPHIFQDLGQATHQLTLPGLCFLGSVHCDSDPVPGNPPSPSAAAIGPEGWKVPWMAAALAL